MDSGERVPVLLRDVATVSYSLKEQENAVMLNGKACVGLSIYKEMRYNTVKAVEDLKVAMEDMERALPGFTFTIVEDQGNYISSAIGEVSNSLIGGIGLAIFVLIPFSATDRTHTNRQCGHTGLHHCHFCTDVF